MAESFVSFLLCKLDSFLKGEAKLLGGVQREVQYVKDELESISAALRVADSIEERDPEVNVWVKQVRDVAYAIEDVIDEFNYRLARDQTDGSDSVIYRVSRCIKNLKYRHQIASQLQGIKSRVIDISERHQRYLYKFNVSEQGSSSITTNSAWQELRGDALLLEQAELVGINEPKKKLIGWLLEDDLKFKAISVVGMGGLGKTTLVKKVYDDAEVKKHFQSHAWINVSQSFKVEELLTGMIHQLFKEVKQPIPQGMETMTSQRLKSIINEFLQQSRYVIVLDDVWHIEAWDAIKYAFPRSNYGSRVMLTTRNVEVASTTNVESNGKVHTLNPLSSKESWTLFCRKTFQGNDCPPHLRNVSEHILKRCEGVPLAIAAISGMLAIKDKSRMDEWETVDRSLGSELDGNEKLQCMTKILSLSFDDLPYNLKACFLYLSVFPEDYCIERMRLIRLWIAEGFVEGREGKTLEEVANDCLKELINRSLIQAANTTLDGRVHSYRVHDLLREIIVSKSKDQNFVVRSSEQSTSWQGKTRRLTVHHTLGNLHQTNSVSRLRSLLMFGVNDFPSNSSMPALVAGGVRLLNVLELRGAPLEVVPNEVVKLYHLTYLSLRDTKVKVLPSRIGRLLNLKTLDLKGTCVTHLPTTITELQHLHHLLVCRYDRIFNFSYSTVHGFKAISGLRCLLSLQDLCCIEVDKWNGAVKEIGRLKELRRLGISKLRREDGATLCSSLEKLTNLRSLKIKSIEEDEDEDGVIDLQHLSSPPRYLQRLSLVGRLEKVPHWLPSLHDLTKLVLWRSKLREDPLESLQALPSLVYLHLMVAYEGDTLCFKARGFQRLEYFEVDSCGRLRWMRVEEGAMPNLEELRITRCRLLEKVPSGIEHLTNLLYLKFYEMSDDFIRRVDRAKEGEDYWKSDHIPMVQNYYLKDGHWIRQTKL